MSAATFALRNFAKRSIQSIHHRNSFLVSRSSLLASSSSTRFVSYFTPEHEYAKVEGKIATCGITDYAQAALGDIVFIDLPQVGDEFTKGESYGSVESVKAASDVYAPVSGKIVAINETVTDEPSLVNSSAEVDGWFIQIEMNDESEIQQLLKEDAYKAHCEKS